MPEKSIDNLSEINYSKKPREQIGFVGEKAAIRPINPKDRTDMQRYKDIQGILGNEFTGTDSTDNELIQEVKEYRPGKDRSSEALYTFGVSGSKVVKESEVGELQGWINVYRDEYVRQLIDQGKLPKDVDGKMVLNVAYAAHPSAESGQMASGLRQVCAFLSKMEGSNTDNKNVEPELIVTAYASNLKSEQVLEAVGFNNKGETTLRYEETNEVFNYKLYFLDWQQLNNIMHNNADKELIAPKNQ